MVNTNIRLIIFSVAECGEALYTQGEKGPKADYDSDHQFLSAKFRLKLKKVGKTTRPYRYNLTQIPYNYTVEVTNGFKELDLINRVKVEWTPRCPDSKEGRVSLQWIKCRLIFHLTR